MFHAQNFIWFIATQSGHEPRYSFSALLPTTPNMKFTVLLKTFFAFHAFYVENSLHKHALQVFSSWECQNKWVFLVLVMSIGEFMEWATLRWGFYNPVNLFARVSIHGLIHWSVPSSFAEYIYAHVIEVIWAFKHANHISPTHSILNPDPAHETINAAQTNSSEAELVSGSLLDRQVSPVGNQQENSGPWT